jgi:hypothetical protein
MCRFLAGHVSRHPFSSTPFVWFDTPTVAGSSPAAYPSLSSNAHFRQHCLFRHLRSTPSLVSYPEFADVKDLPVVNKKELWSCYRASSPRQSPLLVYYNGDNDIGPLGYTQTLFHSLATAAGYDPTVGSGPSCFSSIASGQCVLP